MHACIKKKMHVTLNQTLCGIDRKELIFYYHDALNRDDRQPSLALLYE